MTAPDELDARRQLVVGANDIERIALLDIFDMIDRRRHREALAGAGARAEFPGPLYDRCDDPNCPASYAFRVPPTTHYHPRPDNG